MIFNDHLSDHNPNSPTIGVDGWVRWTHTQSFFGFFFVTHLGQTKCVIIFFLVGVGRKLVHIQY